MVVRTTSCLVCLLAFSLVACSMRPKPKPKEHDAEPTSTAETLSAPVVVPTANKPIEQPSSTPKTWRTGTVALGDTGLTVTLPDGFEIAAGSVDGFWDVEGVYEHVGPIPHRGLVAGLMASSFKLPKKGDAIRSACGKDQRSLLTLPMERGGIFVKCHGESELISIPGQKIITHKVRAWVPAASGSRKGSVECYHEADDPKLIAFTEKVCRSIRSAR
jgi:hypothetical protein